MTSPIDFELGTLATPYALHAVSDSERADIDQRLATVAPAAAAAFHDEVRAVREAMAVLSAATAVEPPPGLRQRLLGAVGSQSRRRPHWRTAVFAVAAALLVAAGGVATAVALRPMQPPSTAEQVLTAPDVRAVAAPIPPGTATLIYSRARNAAMLVMNNVDPPPTGTVYQMWLLDGQRPRSAGTMSREAVGASTTAVVRDIEHFSALAFTVEPGRGSEQPTTAVLAELPLA